jgi:hypothetical protein
MIAISLPVCMLTKQLQALYALLSQRPETKQHAMMGMSAYLMYILVRTCSKARAIRPPFSCDSSNATPSLETDEEAIPEYFSGVFFSTPRVLLVHSRSMEWGPS